MKELDDSLAKEITAKIYEIQRDWMGPKSKGFHTEPDFKKRCFVIRKVDRLKRLLSEYFKPVASLWATDLPDCGYSKNTFSKIVEISSILQYGTDYEKTHLDVQMEELTDILSQEYLKK